MDDQNAERPHDILAADEFEIGTRDERLPPDPTGITEPHDVLAAEEFAMPSPGDHADAGAQGDQGWLPLAALAAAVLVAVLLLRRR